MVVLASMMVGAGAQTPSTSKFGLWTGASVTKKLSHRWSMSVEDEFRTQDGLGKVDRWSGTLSVDYKALDFLKLGASYTFLYTYNMEEWKDHYNNSNVWNGYNATQAYWMPKHRFSFDVTGSHDFDRFSISLRERFQYTHNDTLVVGKNKWRGTSPSTLVFDETEDKTVDAKDKMSLRSRLQIAYNIRHSRLTPYVSCEMYNDLKDAFAYQKLRLSIGGEYKLNKHNSIEMGYIYNTSNDDDEPDGHILNVSYAYKF